jgi:hypothetical protein
MEQSLKIAPPSASTWFPVNEEPRTVSSPSVQLIAPPRSAPFPEK